MMEHRPAAGTYSILAAVGPGILFGAGSAALVARLAHSSICGRYVLAKLCQSSTAFLLDSYDDRFPGFLLRQALAAGTGNLRRDGYSNHIYERG